MGSNNNLCIKGDTLYFVFISQALNKEGSILTHELVDLEEVIYQEETAKRSKVCGCKKGDVSKPSLVKALQQFTNSAGIYLLHYQLGSTTVIHDENPGLKRGSQPSRLTLVGMGHIIETGITTRDYKGHGSPEEEG